MATHGHCSGCLGGSYLDLCSITTFGDYDEYGKSIVSVQMWDHLCISHWLHMGTVRVALVAATLICVSITTFGGYALVEATPTTMGKLTWLPQTSRFGATRVGTPLGFVIAYLFISSRVFCSAIWAASSSLSFARVWTILRRGFARVFVHADVTLTILVL